MGSISGFDMTNSSGGESEESINIIGNINNSF
jgi:hypothetical protein